VRSLTRVMLVSVAVLAAACGRGEKKQTTGLSDDLRSDLALASSSLAYPDLKVIAPEEQAPMSAPKRASAPKRTPARHAAPVQPNVPKPTTETVEVAAAAPEASDVTPTPVPESEPVIASPRPTPVPVQYPADRDRRGGSGPITVVIRGGSAGEDHCEIHNGRGRSRGGILINNRMPPIGVPTFPGGGGFPINPLGRSSAIPRIR
jgi:hypothetical protein